jgi:hypothetical protein
LVLALTTTVVAIVAALVALLGLGTPSGGAATREEVLTSYVDALNRGDADALRQLSGNEGSALEAGISRRLIQYGGRGIRLTEQEIRDGIASYHAYAALSGTMTGEQGQHQSYGEQLYLRSDDGRWYVDLREPLSPSNRPPLPPAGSTPGG